MLEYHRRVDEAVRAEKRHIWPLLDSPPQPSALYRWKTDMSPGKRVCFEKRAGQVLQDLRYETLSGGASGAYVTELTLSLRRVLAAVAGGMRR